MLQQGGDNGREEKQDYLSGKVATGTNLRPFHLPVEIIEEREQIKAQLTPGLLLAVVEDVGIHHAHGVIHDLRAVSRPVEKPEKEEKFGSHRKWPRQKIRRRLLWDCTSTDGRRAGGCSGRV